MTLSTANVFFSASEQQDGILSNCIFLRELAVSVLMNCSRDYIHSSVSPDQIIK